MFDAEDAGITILPGKELRIAAYNINLVNASVIGGLIMLYPKMESPAAVVRNSTFDGTTLSDFNSHMSQQRLVVNDCIFRNNSKLVENRIGVEVYNTAFESNSGILVSSSQHGNRIDGCVFSGTSNTSASGNTAIDIRNSRILTTINNVGISGYSRGLRQDNFVSTNLSCNSIYDNYFGVQLNIDATAYLESGANSSNSVINQVGANFQFAYSNAPISSRGGNEIYNSLSGAKIFSGIINNYSCKATPNYITVNGNTWIENDSRAQPQSMTFDKSKFALKGFSKVSCDECGLQVADYAPQSKSQCFQIKEPTLPFIPELIKCTTCPVIFTTDFNGVNLADAVKRADLLSTIALPKTGNDEQALELYKQILAYPYYVKNQTTYKWLQQAYSGAKYTASELVLKGKKSFVEKQMYSIYASFQPSKYSGHTELEVFLVEIDKAEFLHLFGRTGDALQILSNVRTTVEEPLLGQVNLQMNLYANDQAFIKGQITADAYIKGVGDPGGIIFDPDPTKDCFELTTKLYPSALTEAGDIAFEQSGSSLNTSSNFFQTLSANGLPIEGQLVEVYPVPSTGELNISFGSQVIDQIVVANPFGQVVYTAKTGGDVVTSLNLSHIPKGVYTLTCKNAGENVHIQKIVLD